MNRKPCRHCGKNRGKGRWVRGLCWSCLRNPDVKAMYGPLRGTGPKNAPYEPTETEVEQIITEQMQRIPDWWSSDCERTTPLYEIIRNKKPGAR